MIWLLHADADAGYYPTNKTSCGSRNSEVTEVSCGSGEVPHSASEVTVSGGFC